MIIQTRTTITTFIRLSLPLRIKHSEHSTFNLRSKPGIIAFAREHIGGSTHANNEHYIEEVVKHISI